MLTLWDLIPRRKPRRTPSAPTRAKPAPPARRASTMRDLYEQVTRDCLREHAVRVRKWRTSMSGVAWQVAYTDGSTARLIEAPRPRGPMSAAVFLHEIGHHAIGFGAHKPRCLEELRAWQWSLAEMERRGLNVTDAVRRRMHESMEYAVYKALRSGLKRLPPECEPYLTPKVRAALDRRAAAR